MHSGSRLVNLRAFRAGVLGTMLPLAALMLGLSTPAATAQSQACALATAEELQAALGAPVSGLKPQTLPGGNADLCAGQTPAASVMLRLARRSGGPGAEAAGIEAARKMGAQVEVKTDGPFTCSTIIPPKQLEQYGFNTTCSVLKNGQVAAIEVTAKRQQDMADMGRLRKLVERIAGRL
jgi:hypothetical protein